MPPLHIPGEARALIAELGEPVPRVLLDRYFARSEVGDPNSITSPDNRFRY